MFFKAYSSVMLEIVASASLLLALPECVLVNIVSFVYYESDGTQTAPFTQIDLSSFPVFLDGFW